MESDLSSLAESSGFSVSLDGDGFSVFGASFVSSFGGGVFSASFDTGSATF